MLGLDCLGGQVDASRRIPSDQSLVDCCVETCDENVETVADAR